MLSVLTGLKPFHELGYYVHREIKLPNPLALSRIDGEGALASDNPENPFARWSVVWIPYTTGDFHMGTRQHSYTDNDGHAFAINHVGAENAKKVLNWTFENFPSIDQLVVAGSSAGGFGASYWGGFIVDHYKGVPAHLVFDATGVFGQAPYDAVKHVYGADMSRLKQGDRSVLVEDLLASYREIPSSTLKVLQSGTSRDAAISLYYALINGFDPSSPSIYAALWEKEQAVSIMRIQEMIQHAELFYATGRPEGSEVSGHTLFDSPDFYTVSEGGLTYAKWIELNIIEGRALSAGRELAAQNAGK